MNLNISLFVPELFLVSSAILLILLDLFLPSRGKNGLFSTITFAVTCVAVVLVALYSPFSPQEAFNGFIKKDLLSALAQLLILFTLLLTVLVSYDYIEKFPTGYVGEFYYTLIFAALGGMLMVEANELATLFVSLEVMSISIYILMALFRGDYRGKEAALKYFILGSIGAAVIAYGFAVLYGITGSTLYPEVSSSLNSNFSVAALIGIALVLSGFLFKVGAVPFHGWMPDAYHGAPTPVTLFMGASVKVAVFVALLKLFFPVFLPAFERWDEAVLIFGLVSALFGAFAALEQENFKRMLAYSSISHAGVILTAVATLPALAVYSVFFYLFAYTFMTIAAFGIISLLTVKGFKGENLTEWRGLYGRSPFLALLSVVIFMALAGIPPLLGFWAKFYVLVALIKAGKVLPAVIVMLASLISLGFYLKPIVFAFMKEGREEGVPVGFSSYVAVFISSFILIILGLFPEVVSQASLVSLASFIKGTM
ncbi:NADH dehydrogenase subunit N [Thermovibrio guaymasensis]|uniref:NADH-quinone oxidoreductase subunit N n=1 Tax=Thermovibrio guaymasensis TaxID=240167 RepID=A0A420W8Q0_9BACT|nr:NADH-quinone oxidoreductase subunit N [Thermovibrio guaymasensis]RKQ63693.1 NADH dehydrogenase subunit N [Thermovibrio guaymasensis]